MFANICTNIWTKCLAVCSALVALNVHAQTPSNAYSYSRTSSFSYYQPSDGAKNGLLQSETI